MFYAVALRPPDVQFRGLHYREPDEDCAVPKGVGDDYCPESFRKETVGKAPYRSGHHCRHNKHEIEFGYMDKPIYQSGDDEAYIRVPAGRETVLNASSPEDFLCRADNEEHQQRENHRVLSFFHSIYRIHLSAGEIKEQGREEFPKPEYAPKNRSKGNTRQDVFQSE